MRPRPWSPNRPTAQDVCSFPLELSLGNGISQQPSRSESVNRRSSVRKRLHSERGGCELLKSLAVDARRFSPSDTQSHCVRRPAHTRPRHSRRDSNPHQLHSGCGNAKRADYTPATNELRDLRQLAILAVLDGVEHHRGPCSAWRKSIDDLAYDRADGGDTRPRAILAFLADLPFAELDFPGPYSD